MPKVSIVVPAYNSASTLPATLEALQGQSFADFEIIIVNDGSIDATVEVASQYCRDPRVSLVMQANRGLAGARNSGIAAASGTYIGFCDADDLWAPGKLAAHVAHLESNPDVGLSYSGSELIDEEGRSLGLFQRPRLIGVTAAHVFKRNPIGNGSAAVMRRAALEEIAYRPEVEARRDWVFDETFRQSEDIECWLRFAVATDWQIEGVSGALTKYRVNSNGLSAHTDRQLDAWERMVAKLRPTHPAFFERHEAAARAYQLRYLARRAVSALDSEAAWSLAKQSRAQSWRPFVEEPVKSVVTLGAAATLRWVGVTPVKQAANAMSRVATR